MPKKKDLKKVKYTSMSDLFNQLKEIDSLEDQLRYVTRSLLDHGASGDHDYSFAQAVQMARMAIIEAASKASKSEENSKDDLPVKMFLGKPAEYLKGEANKLAKELEDNKARSVEENELLIKCQKVSSKMNDKFNERVYQLDGASKYYGVHSRMEKALGGKKGVDDLYKATQPNWFSKVFSTYSGQWAALEEAYETFNNPNKVGFGDMDYLEENTNNYLKHKFPKWNPGEEIPAGSISKLSKTELAKVNFSVSVLNAIKEQRAVEEPFHSMVEENKAKDMKYSDIPEEKEEIDQDQLAFQNMLKEDVSLDEKLIDDSLEDSNSLLIEEEKEKEELIEDEEIEVPTN